MIRFLKCILFLLVSNVFICANAQNINDWNLISKSIFVSGEYDTLVFNSISKTPLILKDSIKINNCQYKYTIHIAGAEFGVKKGVQIQYYNFNDSNCKFDSINNPLKTDSLLCLLQCKLNQELCDWYDKVFETKIDLNFYFKKITYAFYYSYGKKMKLSKNQLQNIKECLVDECLNDYSTTFCEVFEDSIVFLDGAKNKIALLKLNECVSRIYLYNSGYTFNYTFSNSDFKNEEMYKVLIKK